MGDSHFKSNIKAKDGQTPTISGFSSISATTLSGGSGGISTSGDIESTAGKIKSSNYIQIGDNKYVFVSTSNTQASIEAEATAINASVRGSITLGVGKIWVFTDDSTAASVTST